MRRIEEDEALTLLWLVHDGHGGAYCGRLLYRCIPNSNFSFSVVRLPYAFTRAAGSVGCTFGEEVLVASNKNKQEKNILPAESSPFRHLIDRIRKENDENYC